MTTIKKVLLGVGGVLLFVFGLLLHSPKNTESKTTATMAEHAISDWVTWDQGHVRALLEAAKLHCDKATNPHACLVEALVPYQQERSSVLIPLDFLWPALENVKAKNGKPEKLIEELGAFLSAVDYCKSHTRGVIEAAK